MRIISIISAVIALCLIYYMIHPLPIRIRVPFLFFSIIVLLPLAHFLRVVLPRYMSRRLHKAVGIDEQEWEQAPRKYSFLRKQVKLIRSLTGGSITAVDVIYGTGVTARLQKPQVIEAFKKFLAGTATYGRDSEAEQLRIQIHTRDNSFSYDAFVPTGNKDDVILKFPECGDYGGIRLSGLKRWLDQKILNKEN